MKNCRCLCGFAVLALAFHPFSAMAQYASAPFKVADSGRRTRIGFFYSVTPACGSLGPIELTIVQSPSHGELGTSRGHDYPTFPATNTHSSCNNRHVPATFLYYTSAPGYVGVDTVRVTARFPDNTARIFSYAISVR